MGGDAARDAIMDAVVFARLASDWESVWLVEERVALVLVEVVLVTEAEALTEVFPLANGDPRWKREK